MRNVRIRKEERIHLNAVFSAQHGCYSQELIAVMVIWTQLTESNKSSELENYRGMAHEAASLYQEILGSDGCCCCINFLGEGV